MSSPEILMSKPSLLSLPNEILLVVFSHLRHPSPLYPLSTLCRRLHFLALPIYLSRIGCLEASSSTGSCSISISAERTTRTLEALQTSLFLDHVQNLSCTFSNPHSNIKDLAIFRSLCSILSRIESTNLQFSLPSEEDYFDGGQATYCNDIVRALNAVLEKSCTSLAVNAVFDDTVSGGSRIPKRDRFRSRRTRDPAVGVSMSSIPLSAAAFRQKTLTTFSPHSEVLFSPYCSAWTIDVLNTFPLTSISIDVSSVPTDAFDALFLVTEIPTLRDLAILNGRIKPSRMHLFLSRHPSITRLHLGTVVVPSLEERLPPDHLPQLRDLLAPAAQVSYLLQAMDPSSTLRSVRVSSHLTRLDLIFTDASLRPIISRLAPVALALVLPVPPKLPRFATDLDLDFREEDSALRLVAALEFVFAEENVAFLNLSAYVSLAKWCEPFPGLKTVELSGFNGNYDTALAVEAFGARSLGVEKLLVNGAEHDLTGAAGRSSGG
ncbi:hypothetical protein K438DRAFT_491990 [Mycena galopus ATCC 62051]|nr:hypothetical protein K438DRAFT_491990 [Mycena galopus ATCC 62051]